MGNASAPSLDSPDANSIPWLLCPATAPHRRGRFRPKRVEQFRYQTKGGIDRRAAVGWNASNRVGTDIDTAQ